MKYSVLIQAIKALNTQSIAIDWRYNSVVFSGTQDGYKIALAAIVEEVSLKNEQTQNFNIEVPVEDLLAKLEELNPSGDQCLELSFQVITDRPEILLFGQPDPRQILQISPYLDEGECYAPDHFEVNAIVNYSERIKTFHLDQKDLRALARKDTVEKDKGTYVIKATKKVAEVTVKTTKKHGTVKTINVPQSDIALALEKDWTISVCLLEGHKLEIVHINGTITAVSKRVNTSVPTVAALHFTLQEWEKMELAAKMAANYAVRSPADENLLGVEVHTGSHPRVKGFSGISVYSAEVGRSDKPGRFLVPSKAIYEFARISRLPLSGSRSLNQDSEQIITVFFQESGEFLITSESVALRGELMDTEKYPSNWHELPVSKEVPAEFRKEEVRDALQQAVRWPNWRNLTDNYCRIRWDNEEKTLTFQGIDGTVSLRPLNRGYDTTAREMYVSAVALTEIIEQLDPRIRIALPTSDTEMCRISDDKTEAGLCVLYEPYFISFRKQQQALPDELVQEVLDSNGTFECRAIEINPIAQAEPTPEPGEIEEETDIVSEVASFVRDYQSYKVFPEDKCPVSDTIRDIYHLATPDGFAKAKLEHKKSGSRTDFNEYVFLLADLADDLSAANESITEILSQDLIATNEIPRLRVLWQVSLNREYARGYNAALADVEHEAKLQGIEGVEGVCENLRSKLPDDLNKIAERLRIWIGRVIVEEQKLAPIAQVEFRPQ